MIIPILIRICMCKLDEGVAGYSHSLDTHRTAIVCIVIDNGDPSGRIELFRLCFRDQKVGVACHDKGLTLDSFPVHTIIRAGT